MNECTILSRPDDDDGDGRIGRNYTADNDVYGWDGTLLHFVTFWTDGKIRFQIEYRRVRGHEPGWPDDCKFGPIH